VFVLGKPVLHSGKPEALPANIRLDWKGLPRTNTLANYENPQITAVIIFIVQATKLVNLD
jgi:hypothetical protein